jgi:hypothetical protein
MLICTRTQEFTDSLRAGAVRPLTGGTRDRPTVGGPPRSGRKSNGSASAYLKQQIAEREWGVPAHTCLAEREYGARTRVFVAVVRGVVPTHAYFPSLSFSSGVGIFSPEHLLA